MGRLPRKTPEHLGGPSYTDGECRNPPIQKSVRISETIGDIQNQRVIDTARRPSATHTRRGIAKLPDATLITDNAQYA